jgi:hypothetical protein
MKLTVKLFHLAQSVRKKSVPEKGVTSEPCAGRYGWYGWPVSSGLNLLVAQVAPTEGLKIELLS